MEDLKISSFERLFKGDKEIDIKKLSYSIKNGYMMLRGHERVLCGTDLSIAVSDDCELHTEPYFDITLKRGLIVVSTPIIGSDTMQQIHIIIINTTPHLSKLQIGESIAQATIIKKR